ncbi:hypothetical protein [Saccharothrix longispora]|uniref:hypothetical protein n=1 Tax=Saccharothrix longispora TaxID=33920 RepID=UPI0028FD7C92|nr:hypothetical protein [Saccharothrix longispora]MDU0290287.1 hypothetical protein [Saccharothrix longispora]
MRFTADVAVKRHRVAGAVLGRHPVFASGVLIAAVPVLVVHLFLRRRIADGVTAGATKG